MFGGMVRGMGTQIGVWAWKIGDMVVESTGPPLRVTLHRLEGAPGVAVVEFAGDPHPHRYPLAHVATVAR